MSLIYTPRGKAREYSPLALNIYSGGCDHACKYCYCRLFQQGWCDTPRRRDLSKLAKEAEQADEQILLCFISDPYNRHDVEWKDTRKALQILSSAKCSVAILTKGGMRCLRDIDIFRSWPDNRLKVGATLTKSDEIEPGAATHSERIAALRELHAAGIKTWASIEPVIDPTRSLQAIEEAMPFVDEFKVGTLNHEKTETDWNAFAVDAVTMIRNAGKMLYVKRDLRKYLPDGYLTAEEGNQNYLTIQDREHRQLCFGGFLPHARLRDMV